MLGDLKSAGGTHAAGFYGQGNYINEVKEVASKVHSSFGESRHVAGRAACSSWPPQTKITTEKLYSLSHCLAH